MRLRALWCALGGAVVVTVALSGATSEPLTERVSVDSAGLEANGFNASSGFAAISENGRFVAFTSAASNLVPGDTNGFSDVFVRDRLAGTTERVSINSAGREADFNSGAIFNGAGVAISADGRFVAFASLASNLVSDDTNFVSDVFVHDRSTHRTERVSIGIGGQGNAGVLGGGVSAALTGVAISANGRFVAFDSFASNLVTGDTDNANDVFVHDRDTGLTERVSVDSSGAEQLNSGFIGAVSPAISADGRFVAFASQATSLVADDTNGVFDVFVRDRQNATTERVSVGTGGAEANSSSAPFTAGAGIALSSDGRFIAFTSLASNLVAGDTNEVLDVFVRDRQEGTTERVSLSASGQANNQSYTPAISADGRFVAFGSTASNLVAGDIAFGDVFVRDRQTNTTERASVDTAGAAGQGDSGGPSISADGRFVAFHSNASNLVEADTNATFDVFVRDRGAFADTEPPLLTVPSAITVDAESPAGAAVVFAASATDNVDPDVPVTCTPASGSTFPVGTTTVSCTATDDAGNTASAAFDIIVRPFVVPFSAFLAEVEVEEPGQVEVKAMFHLGAMSDGIQPASETVTLRVGGFEVTIAAGSFVADDKGRFRFRGAVNGINLDARIRPLTKGGFEFKAGLPREALMPLGTHVEVSLTIGNDTGVTTAAVDVE